MINSKSFVAVAALLLSFGFVAVTLAQSESLASRQLRAAQTLHTTVETLAGDLSDQRERVDLTVKQLAQNQAQVDRLIKTVELIAELVRTNEEGNQKKAFFKELARWACRSEEADCEFRNRLAEMDERLRRLENRIEPEPTPAYPSPSSPPTNDYRWPKPRIWSGPIDLITDQPLRLSRHAVLRARNVYLDSADGIPCFGDMYREWNGAHVLLKHRYRYEYRSALAAW